MQYVIYTSKKKAAARRDMITDDARVSGFLNPTEQYEAVINHPTEDKAALPILVLDPIYYNGLPTQRFDYSVFFTDMEKAGAVDELPADWYTEVSMDI